VKLARRQTAHKISVSHRNLPALSKFKVRKKYNLEDQHIYGNIYYKVFVGIPEGR
jgi:hypothetical protein